MAETSLNNTKESAGSDPTPVIENGIQPSELASAADAIVSEQQQEQHEQQQQTQSQSPLEARSEEVHFAELNRPSVARLQKGMEIEHELVPSQRDCIRALRKYTTLTNAEIFRRVGVSHSNGYRYLRNVPEKGPDEKPKPKPGRGRKRKLDETIVKQIILEIEKQPAGEKTKSWEELCKASQADVTPITLKRAVENAGYYKCPACQRGKICIHERESQCSLIALKCPKYTV